MWPGKCFIQTFLKSNCVLPWEGVDNLYQLSKWPGGRSLHTCQDAAPSLGPLKKQTSSSLSGHQTMADCARRRSGTVVAKGSFPKEAGNWRAVKTDEASMGLGFALG